MENKIININGIEYKIRYKYKRDDGSNWIVLDVSGGFWGQFGDEIPESYTTKL